MESAHEVTVAAIGDFKPKNKQQQRNKQNKNQTPSPLPPRPQGNQKSQQNPPLGLLARQSVGLCYYNWTFGDKAHSCESPCTWQGN